MGSVVRVTQRFEPRSERAPDPLRGVAVELTPPATDGFLDRPRRHVVHRPFGLHSVGIEAKLEQRSDQFGGAAEVGRKVLVAQQEATSRRLPSIASSLCANVSMSDPIHSASL